MAKPRNVALEIAAANESIKILGGCLRVQCRKGQSTLNLVGTLPSKDNPSHWKQQRISLGVRNSVAGIAFAKAEALRLSALLDQHRFDWAEIEKGSEADTCEQAIAKFKAQWIREQKHGTAELKEKRFKENFWYRGFSKLPQNKIITATVLETTLNAGWDENSAGKKKAAQNLAQLAKFCDISAHLPGGKYSSASVEREIPNDALIEKCIDAIAQPDSPRESIRESSDGWQWIAGMMATYGLRDHEAFFCELNWETVQGDRWLVCTVKAEANTLSGKTKTGARKILPLPRKWVDRWELSRVRRPKISRDYGDRTARQLSRAGLPFAPYDLRHAWNLRCSLEKGIPDIIRYSMMGHSASTNEIYQKHIRTAQLFEGFVSGLDD